MNRSSDKALGDFVFADTPPAQAQKHRLRCMDLTAHKTNGKESNIPRPRGRGDSFVLTGAHEEAQAVFSSHCRAPRGQMLQYPDLPYGLDGGTPHFSHFGKLHPPGSGDAVIFSLRTA